METADANPNQLTSLKPVQITESLQKKIQNEISELVQKAKDGYTSYLETSIDLKITMAKRVYTELSILVTGTIAAQKAILHINNDNELNKLTQLRQEMASLTYEGGDTVLGQIEAGVYEFVDGLVNGLLEVPLVAIDTSLRLNLFLEHLLLQGLADVGVSIANIAGYDKEPYVLTPPQVGAFSSIVDEYDRDGDEAKFREKLKHMVIGFTPAGAYYAGKEFGDAWIDFGSSDKKDFKRVTTATLNLMLLGIGTKKAMAEYRASKEVLNHANELEQTGKVTEAQAYRQTAEYKKADATEKLMSMNRQMKDAHQAISNYIQEKNSKLSTWSRTAKDKFSTDNLKPAQHVVKDSPAKTKVTVEDPLVIDELIENSFTNDSFFYEVADKEFYVSDWDIVKVEKLGRFDSMSEQAFKEMQDYVRVD
ncbi:hypothetical protein [Faucicola atlantae]|uniref:hypothetical protein n=1 Tax=Faucicola atlantae TaxID=34059 RepID=UPI0025AF6013|nr:hypothetical protein [Moraxella atlantae]